MQGYSSLPLFLSVSQQDKVMTEWHVYLGFPCLASSLDISGLNVSGYLTDVSGLKEMLAPALILSEAQEVVGRGEEKRGQVCTCHCPLSWSFLYLSRLLQRGEAAYYNARHRDFMSK